MAADCAHPRHRYPALSIWGALCVIAVIGTTIVVEPEPGLQGRGPWVALSLAAFVVGLTLALRARDAGGRRLIGGLVPLIAASCVLTALQPDGAAVSGVYFTIVLAGIGLRRVPAVIVATAALAAGVVVLSFGPDATDKVLTLVISAVPWFFVMRLVRELRDGRIRAEALVRELETSRAAEASAAAAAERGRVARDMHDVLAHSLSALAIQLEGARLMARNRDADPELLGAVERAHHLAAGGLAEARQAIGALHGDELPGPERLPALVDGFADQSHVDASLTVTGEPGPQSSEARLALYRTAQEALTNVRKHSAAERVDVALDYGADGTTLTVRDVGIPAPVAVGASGSGGGAASGGEANGPGGRPGGSGGGAASGGEPNGRPGRPDGASGGYGLSGMRERAELLGGTLVAAHTGDGFQVELWLPR